MVNDNVVAYIREQMKNGFPPEEIRNYLIGGGYYTSDVVDSAIMAINNEQYPKSSQPPTQEITAKKPTEEQKEKPEGSKKNTKTLILYLLVIILGISVGLKALAYFEVIDVYAMIGFDPFSFLGGTISGSLISV